ISLIVLTGCDDIPDLSLPNEPPIAADDMVNIKQNETVIIDVISNDFDIDGDTLLIVITTTTTNGTLDNSTGSIVYTPNPFFIGSDQFSYEITDQIGQASSATVSIDIARHESRAVFSATAGTETRVLMLDSRDPGTAVDLTQALDTGEKLLNWGISEQLSQAILLTDADRILAVPLDDPATPASIFDLDTTTGAVDGGLALSTAGNVAAYTLDNRFVILLDLVEENDVLEFDTGFENSTLTPSFFSRTDTALILQGTLGADADEHAAIYYVGLSTPGLIEILDDIDNMDSAFTRLLDFNNMVWLTADAATTVPPAAYSCQTPPPQTLSAAFNTSLISPGPGINLNEASGLLADPTNIISYNNGPGSLSLFVAACPPEAEVVQIFDIPYLTAESAQIVAAATDASDGLWNIDVAPNGDRLIYVFEGDTGLRVLANDLTGENPVESDLTASLPDYQTYTVGAELRVPPSIFSADGRLWLFLAPVDGALSRVVWFNLETSELNTVDLPFTATNLVSDGFFVIVQGETAGEGTAPIATIELLTGNLDVADVPGVVAEGILDPVNQIESAINVIAVP
ncbi:MAG: Ig-like domain-containing protein, partial [Gammaproteobacteria bacterium]|nr:Ig-like domain-containing protein [Gammaproteobacteria bacterium]